MNIRPSRKHILIAIGFLSVALAALYPIRGMFPPFYYEQYNTVKDRLETIEGLQIRDSWQHKDIRLEDCGFDVAIDDRNASLTFVDHQDWVALFLKIDGIRISMDGQQRLVTCEQMKSAGLEIDGLSDVLENLGSVIEFCSDQANPILVPDAEYDYWDHLNYAQINFFIEKNNPK
ncbi:MAG: hypothetical protein HN494_14805 [Opitutae bacterium]|jgi:hypothetical protein|nr:hypothetical protein [Opitutae bacterium]MBT4665787.1 hypothetical protein [Opitutae bacterium]